MAGIIDLERAAEKLRRYLKLAPLPDLKMLCLFRFFDLLAEYPPAIYESYIREFASTITEIAPKCRPGDFLPEEKESLNRLSKIIANHPLSTDPVRMSLADLEQTIINEGDKSDPVIGDTKAVSVNCLFVEYNPDLDLPPRGRLLKLEIVAEPISARKESDDIVIRNPVEEPDDRFVTQARDSVAAARKYLLKKFGLPLKKRYRFDFRINTTGARLTGDSLGVAMAVGAVIAVSRVEIFREKLAVTPEASFSGALTPDGVLTPIDAEGLQLKIYRAFHSATKYLVVPRSHITEAWDYLSQLEKDTSGRKLELLGAETLAAVAEDPRLVATERYNFPAYTFRKAWKNKRRPLVEVPILAALSILLWVLLAAIWPKTFDPWFDWRIKGIEILGNKFRVINSEFETLWISGEFPHNIDSSGYNSTTKRFCAIDTDSDNKDELFFIPFNSNFPSRLQYYDQNGKLVWEHFTFKDDSRYAQSSVFEPPGLLPYYDKHNKPYVITECAASNPWRIQLMLFDTSGIVTGPYTSRGACCISEHILMDINRDGSNDIILGGSSNILKGACLMAINPFDFFGTCPPYINSTPISSTRRMGGQLYYIYFPVSPLSQDDYVKSGTFYLRYDSANATLLAVTFEGYNFVLPNNRLLNFKTLPRLYWYLDSNFIPKSLIFEDGTPEYINHLLVSAGKETIRDFISLRDSLLSEVIVYKNDSLVHHPAAGIDFYKK